jgi:hypothetical protein
MDGVSPTCRDAHLVDAVAAGHQQPTGSPLEDILETEI